MTSFGSFLKECRETHGWTQTEFGAQVGINSSAISRIENGTKQFNSSKLAVVARLFNVDLSKIKELYYGDKFAKEVLKNDCPSTAFMVAEEAVAYLRSKNNKPVKPISKPIQNAL